MGKKLTLKKETLAELTSDQLRYVHGGVGSESCTSCGCSCYAASCIAMTLTDSIVCLPPMTAITSAFIDVNCG